MRFYLPLTLCIFMLFGLQTAFADTLEKEFDFSLAPGEASKSWEINIPLPANETGKFIGRDFKPVVNGSNTLLIVERELLSDRNYYAKGSFIDISSSAFSTLVSGKLQISLYTGNITPKDIPARPYSVAFDSSFPINVEWEESENNVKSLPTTARYIHYQVKDQMTDSLLAEQVVPVYLTGFRFKIRYQLRVGYKDYILMQFSNASAQYSKPLKMGLPQRKN